MADARTADADCTNAGKKPVFSLRIRRLSKNLQQQVKDLEVRYTTFIADHRLPRWKSALPPRFKSVPITFSVDQSIAGSDDELKVQSFKVLTGLQSAFRQIQASTDPPMLVSDFTEDLLSELDPADWQLMLGSVLSLHVADLADVRSLCHVPLAQESLKGFIETEQFRVMEFLRLELARVQTYEPVLPANFMAGDPDAVDVAGPGEDENVDVLEADLRRAMEHEPSAQHEELLPRETLGRSQALEGSSVLRDQMEGLPENPTMNSALPPRTSEDPGISKESTRSQVPRDYAPNEGQPRSGSKDQQAGDPSTPDPLAPAREGSASLEPQPTDEAQNHRAGLPDPPVVLPGASSGPPVPSVVLPGDSFGQFASLDDALEGRTWQAGNHSVPPNEPFVHAADARGSQPGAQPSPQGVRQTRHPALSGDARDGQRRGQAVSQEFPQSGQSTRAGEASASGTKPGRETHPGVPLDCGSRRRSASKDVPVSQAESPHVSGDAPFTVRTENVGLGEELREDESARIPNRGGAFERETNGLGSPTPRDGSGGAPSVTFNARMQPDWDASRGFPGVWDGFGVEEERPGAEGASDKPIDFNGADRLHAAPNEERAEAEEVSNVPIGSNGADRSHPARDAPATSQFFNADPLCSQGQARPDGHTEPPPNVVGEKRKGDYGSTIQPCLGCGKPGHIRAACDCGLTREDAKRIKWEKKSTELEHKYKGVPYHRSAQTDFNSTCEKLLGLKMKHQERVEFVLLALSADSKGNPSKTPMVFATGPPGNAFLGHAAVVKLWAKNAEGHFLEKKKEAEKIAAQVAVETSGRETGEGHASQGAQALGMLSKEVVNWLEDQEMAQYAGVFRDYHWYKLDDLKEMTADSLSEMGIKGLHKQRLLKALNNLHTT